MSSTARCTRLQYDVLNDFEPVALLTDNSQLIVGRKSLPANDLKELIAWLKANPDKATAGTAGVGSPQHVVRRLVPEATGTRFQFVALPRRRAGDAGPGGRPDRPRDCRSGRPRCRKSAPAPSRLCRSPARAACRRRRTCRLPTRPGCPASTPRYGTRSGRPRERRRRSSRRLNAAIVEALRRSGSARAARRSRPAGRSAATSRRRRCSRAAQGRNREVVADHQGGEHQERVTPQCAR